jgi:hypothetical protein
MSFSPKFLLMQLFFFLVTLGFEQGLMLAKQASYNPSHSVSPSLWEGFFQMGPHKLFAWTSFKP